MLLQRSLAHISQHLFICSGRIQSRNAYCIAFCSWRAGDIINDFSSLLDRESVQFPELFDAFNVRGNPAGLNTEELAALMSLVFPKCTNLTFKHVRYLQLILDANGDSAVSLDDLRHVFLGYASAGYVFAWHDELRLEDVLMRLAQRVRAGVSRMPLLYVCY